MDRPRSPFSYKSLSKPADGRVETRLICLHPGAFADRIYCTIYHANILERRPETEYTALSYVWGDATRTNSISLSYHQLSTSEHAHTWTSASSPGGNSYESFQVTRNLESALRHLRQRASERILWVDAICIDQSNWEERLSQVGRMGDVYKNSKEVRIWLGAISDVSVPLPISREELENYQSGQGLMSKRSSDSLLSPEGDTGVVSSSQEEVVKKVLLAARAYIMDEDHRPHCQKIGGNRFPDESEYLGIQIIASQPWWRRVWVIQEATIPAHDPVMQCGPIKMRYRSFLESARHCMFRNVPLKLDRTYISLTVHGMFNDGHDPSTASLGGRLLTYLSCMSGNFEVTNPEDRIFGVYGMLRMTDCHANIFFLMTRDQRKQKPAEFYHRVAIWNLFDPHAQSYPLRILENGPSNIKGVPSWVPTWESKRWIGEHKNQGAPESKYDILARGTAMGKIYHQSPIDICKRCTAMYKKKWGAPKSVFDIDVRCTEIRIRDALALGRVMTVVEVHPVQGESNIDVLRKAILELEQRILAALKAVSIPHTDARTHIQRFRDFLRLNFWDVDAGEGSSSSEPRTTLEDFLQSKRKSSKRKDQRRGRKVSGQRAADPILSSSPSLAKLSSFFGYVSHLVIGSNIVGHIFEDSLPSWQRDDRLYLIPECRWVLGLRRSGIGYQYMYRVFISDLGWQQRREMFNERGIYKNIVLV